MVESGHQRRWRVVWVLLLLVAGGIAAMVWQAKVRTGSSSNTGVPVGEAGARLDAYRRLCEGKSLAGDRKYKEAFALFDELVRTEAGSAFGWDAGIQAAASLGYMGKHEEALARLDGIIAKCPFPEQLPQARMDKADVQSLAGQYAAAVKSIEDLLAEYTDQSQAICADTLSTMVLIHERRGQFGLVHAALVRISEDYPSDEDTMRKRAERGLVALREKLVVQQQPIVDRSIAENHARKVDRLETGVNTWSVQGGPYVVIVPLTIAAGAMLRIEAGTQVRFGVKGGIQVEGELEIAGAAEKPVRLGPLSDEPGKDWWPGLQFAGHATAKPSGEAGNKSGTVSRLHHCSLSGAEIAVQVRGGRVELDDCTIQRSGRVSIRANAGAQLIMTRCALVDGYRAGVECERAMIQMTDCKIFDQIARGVSLRDLAEGSLIRRSRIEHCGWEGILLRGRSNLNVDNCQIRENRGIGIRTLSGATASIINTLIEMNGGLGIRFEDRWEGECRDNTVRGNDGGGIAAQVRCKGQIVGNRLESNGAAGLLLRLDSTPTVIGNVFLRNKGPGLLLQNAQPAILRGNQFIENTEGAIRNEGNAKVQAAENWWGTTAEAEIRKMMHDRRVNPDWAEVVFQPWLTEPPKAVATAPN